MRSWQRRFAGSALAAVFAAGFIVALMPGQARAVDVTLLQENFDSYAPGAWPTGFYQFQYNYEYYAGAHVVSGVTPDPPSMSNCFRNFNKQEPGTGEVTVPLAMNADDYDFLTIEAMMMLPLAKMTEEVMLSVCTSPTSRSRLCGAGLRGAGSYLYVDGMSNGIYQHLTRVNYNEWVKVREVINLRTMTYDVYVNDIKFNGAALNMSTADPSAIGALLLWIGYWDLGYAYYDDLRVSATVATKESWLAINTFQLKGNKSLAPETDNFVMSGTFNLEPGTLDPAVSDVTLSIDNWSVTIPAASWTTKGPGKPWTARVDDGNISAQMTYWVKGSSKCTFKFAAKKQTINGDVPNFPDLPVRLQIGSVFDGGLIAGFDGTVTSAKMSAIGPEPAFILNNVGIKTSAKPGKDSIVIVGRVDMDVSAFDPSTQGIELEVQGQTIGVDPGNLPAPKKNKLTYRNDLGGGRKFALVADLKTGKITFTLTGFDLDPIANPGGVAFRITNMPGAAWARKVWMSTDAKSVKFTY